MFKKLYHFFTQDDFMKGEDLSQKVWYVLVFEFIRRVIKVWRWQINVKVFLVAQYSITSLQDRLGGPTKYNIIIINSIHARASCGYYVKVKINLCNLLFNC